MCIRDRVVVVVVVVVVVGTAAAMTSYRNRAFAVSISTRLLTLQINCHIKTNVIQRNRLC